MKNSKKTEDILPPLYIRIIRKIPWTILTIKHKIVDPFLRRIYRAIKRRLYNFLSTYTPLPRYLQQKRLKNILLHYYGYKNFDPNKRIRIAIISQSATTNPTSSFFIRLISPLTHPVVSDRISFFAFPQNSYKIPSIYNVYIVQRTAIHSVEIAKKLIYNARINNAKIIVETDDAFHSIDQQNTEHDEYAGKHDALEYIIKNAAEVWVSTPNLKVLYDKIHPRVVVFNNTLDSRIWPIKEHKNNVEAERDESVKIVYMGTATHSKDFNLVFPAIQKLHDTLGEKIDFSIIGVTSKDMEEYPWIHRIRQEKHGAIYPNFVTWFTHTLPVFDIGICPLEDNAFNSYKSDIKCLDYIAAGILPVVSDVEAYNTKQLSQHIIKTRNTVHDWYNTLLSLAVSPKPVDLLQNGKAYIENYREAKTIATKMLQHLEKLL